jgi:hypothetical protein
MSPPPQRTLPIRVPILPGESLDSWLEALARRNGMTVRALLPVLGWPAPRKKHSLVQDIPSHALRSMERQTGLPPGRLDEAVLDRFLHLGWIGHGGSRYCPHCLTQHDGRWRLAWRMPWVFACVAHHVLLNDTCPTCTHTPRMSTPATAGRDHPAICPGPTTVRRNPCGTDLRAAHAPLLMPDDPLLATQRWINDLITASSHAVQLSRKPPPATAQQTPTATTRPEGSDIFSEKQPTTHP